MLPDPTLPASLLAVLANLRGGFTTPSFATFVALATGLIANTGKGTVTGMLTGAGLARRWSHDRAHKFFSRAAWSGDTLGMYLSRLIVRTLLPDGAAITVAVDDTLFKKRGKKVFGAGWQHDGAARGTDGVGFGVCFVVVGIIVELTAPAGTLVGRYAWRWSIEITFEEAREHLGAGQARNRVRQAVERTTPFTLYCYTIVVLWYTLHGHAPTDVADRRERQPWYTSKTEPAFADMAVKLRRVIIAARFSPIRAAQPTVIEIREVQQAWAQAGLDLAA
jgi:hypothetical protein